MLIILCGSIVYAANCFLLAAAWRRLLVWFGQGNAALRVCYAVYARTQIAKYIPGNVFHFAGRHVLGHQAGFNHGFLAGAALYEVTGLLVAFSTIAFCGMSLGRSNWEHFSLSFVSMIFLSALLVPLVFNQMITRWPQLRKLGIPEREPIQIITGVVPIYFFYLLFCLIGGGILLGVVFSLSEVKGVRQEGAVVTAFALSWIAGFITPGSPAGVGVRDAMIVVYLRGSIGESAGLLVALIFRTITVLGDVLFFLSSYPFRSGVRIRSGTAPRS